MSDELKGKIVWCGKQKKGITLIQPNENLCAAYLKKAETSLKSMQLNYQEIQQQLKNYINKKR